MIFWLVISGDTAFSCAASPCSCADPGASPCSCAFPVPGLELATPVFGREVDTVLGREDMGDRITVTPLAEREPNAPALWRNTVPLYAHTREGEVSCHY